MRRWLPLLLLCACSTHATPAPDGGVFVVPDSGYIYDSGPEVVRDAEPIIPDSGPFQCPSTCAPSTVCGCLDTDPPACGCNPPQSYEHACDPQVSASCRAPYQCVLAKKLTGYVYLCTDGREGSHCSHTDDRCATQSGCVCRSSFLGVECICTGDPGPTPTTCDPLVPASCPNGICQPVMGPGGSMFYICSDGSQGQPCMRGDNSCTTSLGCTCALSGQEELCTCSEPGTQAGDPCDPRVQGSCAAPLECQIRFDQERGGNISECAGPSTFTDAGTDPYQCDPMNPLCPQGYDCTEVAPGRYRCTIGGP